MIEVQERNDDWGAALIAFQQPAPAYATTVRAVVPLIELDSYTKVVLA